MVSTRKRLKTLLAAVLCIATIVTVAVCVSQATVAAQVVWNGAPDRAVAADIPAVQNNTRKNASGPKITSNAHSADFPGIYFIWDSKQKDNGYLKVDAGVFETYESFTLTSKESNTYWDFAIAPQGGQVQTGDGCYVFFIPKVYNNKNINMVFLSEAVRREVITSSTDPNYSTTMETTTYVTTSSLTTTDVVNFGQVITGEWRSIGNYMAQVSNNTYLGDFGSPVVQMGVMCATEPTFASPKIALATAISPPYSVHFTGLSNGTYYYRAFVRTADGTYYYGETLMATYP